VDLTIAVKRFIEREWDRKSPLLLGYSGGGDSKSLLYALLETEAAECLHLAHVDHGWRKTSSHEAQLLAEEAASLKLPFHTIRLREQPSQNLEEAGRIARISFFSSLFAQIPFQALLLAHHADDVAETALKRLLEGAHLQNMGAMAEISSLQGMTVWRPLLKEKKRALTKSGFIDPTNVDPKFLRARMRQNLIPMLSESFGKEVSENLSLVSKRAYELRQYLDRKIASIEVLEGPWGKAAHIENVERIEARHLLLKWAQTSREILEAVLCNTTGKHGPFIVDRGWVFLPSPHLPQFGPEILLTPGRFVSGDWDIEVVETNEAIAAPQWQDLWKGKFTVQLPQGVLKKSERLSSEEYRIAKIPPFLRPYLPSIDTQTLFAKPINPRFFVNITISSTITYDSAGTI